MKGGKTAYALHCVDAGPLKAGAARGDFKQEGIGSIFAKERKFCKPLSCDLSLAAIWGKDERPAEEGDPPA